VRELEAQLAAASADSEMVTAALAAEQQRCESLQVELATAHATIQQLQQARGGSLPPPPPVDAPPAPSQPGPQPLTTATAPEWDKEAVSTHTTLLAAAYTGDVEALSETLAKLEGTHEGGVAARLTVLEEAASAAGQERRERTALQAAASAGHVNAMKVLLAAGAAPATKNREVRIVFLSPLPSRCVCLASAPLATPITSWTIFRSVHRRVSYVRAHQGRISLLS
jgi:hypothetical protein